MNVYLFCRSYFPSVGGIETSIYQLSKALYAKGHVVTIVTTSDRPDKERKEYGQIRYAEKRGRVTSLIPPMNLANIRRSLLSVLEEEKEQPDLIISRDSFMTCIANEKYNSVPVIYIPSMDVKKFLETRKRKCRNIKEIICALLEIWTYNIEIKNQEKSLYDSTYNLVFCEGMKRQLKDTYNKKNYDVKVCYPGCTFDDIECSKKVGGMETRFLFVGRISAEKNLMMLLTALEEITEKIHLTIVGDGLGIEVLKQKAKRLKKNIEVKFEGYQTDTLKYYMNTDYFVLPSQYESFGQVIIEAFTCGVPVIGFCSIDGQTNTAIGELVGDEITGFVCKEFSARALAANMEKAIALMKQPKRRKQMEDACVQYAREKCSWDRLAEVCVSLGRNKRI